MNSRCGATVERYKIKLQEKLNYASDDLLNA